MTDTLHVTSQPAGTIVLVTIRGGTSPDLETILDYLADQPGYTVTRRRDSIDVSISMRVDARDFVAVTGALRTATTRADLAQWVRQRPHLPSPPPADRCPRCGAPNQVRGSICDSCSGDE